MTVPQFKNLFTPLELGQITLPNRIVMAPMTRFRCTSEGVATNLVGEHYVQRASAGLIICESSYVHPSGRIGYQAAGICTRAQVQAWRAVTDGVHGAGGRIFLQMMHGGRFSHSTLQPDGTPPRAPSSIAAHDDPVRVAGGLAPSEMPRALTRAEIHELIAAYGDATARADEAGFDGVELHAANGYLPSQFLSSGTNQRVDEYGGNLANRCRFALEVIEAMSAVRGASFVGVRVSPGIRQHEVVDEDPIATHAYFGKAVENLGLAYLHVQTVLDFVEKRPAQFDPFLLMRENYRGTILVAGQFDRYSGEGVIASGTAAISGTRFP